jgi:hypothetical protein
VRAGSKDMVREQNVTGNTTILGIGGLAHPQTLGKGLEIY